MSRVSLLVGFVFLLASLQLLAKQNCATNDLIGSYVFASSGVQPPGAPLPAGPFVRLGRTVYDGNGNQVTSPVAASNNGTPGTNIFLATFTLDPDCTYNEVLFVPPPINAIFPVIGVVANDGKQITAQVVVPFPGLLIRSTGEKQNIRGCSTDSFVGHFQLDVSGETTSPAGKFVRVGTLDSTGAGTFTANTVANYEGNIVPEVLSGTYTVDPTCFVTLNYTATSQAGSQPGSMLAGMVDRDRAKVMVTNAGFVVLGTLTRR